MVLRKPSTSTTAATFLASLNTQPMTRIGHMRHHSNNNNDNVNAIAHDEDTKDSNGSDGIVGGATAATVAQTLEVQVSEEEQDAQDNERNTAQTPLRLQAIKVEHQQHNTAAAQHSLPVTMATALPNNLDWTELTEWIKNAHQFQLHHLHNNNSSNIHSTNNNNSSLNHSNMLSHHGHAVATAVTPPPAANTPAPASLGATVAGLGSASVAGTPTDADYMFLISLYPYLKEMSGKQNRRFRQKVVGLIDNVLDNVDV